MGRTGRRGPSVAFKLGALLAVLVALLLIVAGVMFAQLRGVERGYDTLLADDVHHALDCRRLQVAVKTQVQEFKNVLLRGTNPADVTQYSAQMKDQQALVEQLNVKLIAEVPDPLLVSELQQFRVEYAAMNQVHDDALAAFLADPQRDITVPDAAMRGLNRPLTERVDRIVSLIETSIADKTAAQKADRAGEQVTLVVIGLLVLAATLIVVAVVIVGVVRPIRKLTQDAYTAAHESLPAAVAQIKAMPSDATEPPSVDPVEVRTGDELEDLGQALTAMQDRAVTLAMEQHRAERESAEMLINLGRRNQNLLGRTLSYITELERTEKDPDVLAELFRLDHATTRIRRGAESMLVLAGATQTRTWSRPVPIGDVARAALSEVEDYQRVDLYHLEDVAVLGNIVADVVHLVAELVENATRFSPPDTRVTLVGQRLSEGYRLRIVDNGIGMTSRELEQANERIRQAVGGRVDTQLLGLHVVGRLAARRDIDVLLEPSAGRGITATITLPASLLFTAASGSVSTGGAGGAAGQVSEGGVGPTLQPATPQPATPQPAIPQRSVPPPSGGVLTASRAPGPRPVVAMSPVEPKATSVPRRVRGAQLPDAGASTERSFATPDTSQIRGRLYALQNGVQAARHDPAPAGAAPDAASEAEQSDVHTPPAPGRPRS